MNNEIIYYFKRSPQSETVNKLLLEYIYFREICIFLFFNRERELKWGGAKERERVNFK